MTLTVESPLAVALLVGLWCEADDAGTFEWKPLTIKARILPAITEDVNGLLAALNQLNFVRRFDIGGKAYGVIRNFVRYQRPKSPRDIYPSSEDSSLYAGFDGEGKRPHAPTGRKSLGSDSEEVPNLDGSPSGNLRQREGVGGRRDDEGGKDNSQERSSIPANALTDFKTSICAIYTQAGSMSFPDTGRAEVWVAQGREPSICLAVLRERVPPDPQKPLKYFEGAIADAHDKPRPSITGPPRIDNRRRDPKIEATQKIMRGLADERNGNSKIVG